MKPQESEKQSPSGKRKGNERRRRKKRPQEEEVYVEQPPHYFSKHKAEMRKKYFYDEDEGATDEFAEDFSKLRFQLHSIEYNYYQEALKQLLYEQNKPLVPLKLGPIIQNRPQGDPARNFNGSAVSHAQFGQGQLYNRLVSPSYEQFHQSQMHQAITGNQNGPNFLPPINNQQRGSKVSQQRLSQDLTMSEEGTQQEEYQMINGRRYKVKRTVVNGPVQASYGADEYLTSKNKSKKAGYGKSNQNATAMQGYNHRQGRNSSNEVMVPLNDTHDERVPRRGKVLQRKGAPPIFGQEEVPLARIRQKRREVEAEDLDDEQIDGKPQLLRQRPVQNKGTIHQKGPGQSRRLAEDHDGDDDDQADQSDEEIQFLPIKRQHRRVPKSEDSSEHTRSRMPSRRTTNKSRIEEGDSDEDNQNNGRSFQRKGRGGSGSRHMHTKIVRHTEEDEEEDMDELEEYRPKKGKSKAFISSEQDDNVSIHISEHSKRSKSMVRSRRDVREEIDENRGPTRSQRNLSMKRRIVARHVDMDDIDDAMGEEEAGDTVPHSLDHTRTIVRPPNTRQKKTMLQSNQQSSRLIRPE